MKIRDICGEEICMDHPAIGKCSCAEWWMLMCVGRSVKLFFFHADQEYLLLYLVPLLSFSAKFVQTPRLPNSVPSIHDDSIETDT